MGETRNVPVARESSGCKLESEWNNCGGVRMADGRLGDVRGSL